MIARISGVLLVLSLMVGCHSQENIAPSSSIMLMDQLTKASTTPISFIHMAVRWDGQVAYELHTLNGVVIEGLSPLPPTSDLQGSYAITYRCTKQCHLVYDDVAAQILTEALLNRLLLSHVPNMLERLERHQLLANRRT